MMIRFLLIVTLIVYVFVGACVAVAMKQAIPALNSFGMVYIGATWPVSAIGIDTVPEPGAFADLMFTFE